MVDLHFAFYGRICAVIYFLSAVFVSCWQMIYYPTLTIPLGSYTLVSGLIVGLIELPVCFSCCGPCKKLAGYLRVVMGYWAVRGILYAGLSAAGYVIYEIPVGNVQVINPSLLTVQILATITAALYFVATGRCEPNPAQTGDDSGRGAAASSTGAAKAAQPAAEATATAKPATSFISAGRALFGGGDNGATAPVVPAPIVSAVAAPAAAALVTAAKAGLFSGTAGSGRSKYGGFADDDRPEVNPFLTG